MKKPAPDLSGFVNASGQRIFIDPQSPSFAPRRRVVVSARSYHKGWTVEGWPPGFLAEEERLARDAMSRWNGMTEDQKAQALRAGDRAPKPWDEATYVRTRKRKRVRSKPYEIPEAAEQCRAMAEKDGWQYTTVVQQKKGDENA